MDNSYRCDCPNTDVLVYRVLSTCPTAGTTGAPKGAIISHANLVADSSAAIWAELGICQVRDHLCLGQKRCLKSICSYFLLIRSLLDLISRFVGTSYLIPAGRGVPVLPAPCARDGAAHPGGPVDVRRPGGVLPGACVYLAFRVRLECPTSQ